MLVTSIGSYNRGCCMYALDEALLDGLEDLQSMHLPRFISLSGDSCSTEMSLLAWGRNPTPPPALIRYLSVLVTAGFHSLLTKLTSLTVKFSINVSHRISGIHVTGRRTFVMCYDDVESG